MFVLLAASAEAKKHHHTHHLKHEDGGVTGGGGDAPAEAQCSCETPGEGMAHFNKYTCTNGHKAWCAHNEECFVSGETRPWSLRSELCRSPPCKCKTPLTGTSHHNEITCKYDHHTGDTRFCMHNQECYRTDTAPQGAAQLELCRIPRCQCVTPLAGTEGHNHIECTDGSSDKCADNQECFGGDADSDGTAAKGKHHQELCRVPRCSCTTPLKGTKGHNAIHCSDGTEDTCAENEECFNEDFEAETVDDRQKLCRIPECHCKTPLTGTSGHNRIVCTDDVSNPFPIWCHHTNECFEPQTVMKPRNVAQMELCRVPMCHCETPNAGTSGHNRIRCTDNSNVWCAPNEACIKSVDHLEPYNRRSALCAVPGRQQAARRRSSKLLRRLAKL